MLPRAPIHDFLGHKRKSSPVASFDALQRGGKESEDIKNGRRLVWTEKPTGARREVTSIGSDSEIKDKGKREKKGLILGT